MTYLEKLAAIFASIEFPNKADKHTMLGSLGGYDLTGQLLILAEWACDMYNLKADVQDGTVILTAVGCRVKRPPYITVSLQNGHVHASSCIAVRFTGSACIQLFEGGVDDTELGSGGEGSNSGIKAKGHVLQ